MRRIIKGSSAFEYLMTYGWAIAVVLIVGFFIYQSGVLNPPPPQGMSGFSRITILEWKVSADDKLDLVVMNGANLPVHLSNIEVTIGGVTCGTGCPIDMNLRSGEVYSVKLNCPPCPCGMVCAMSPPDKFSVGETYMAEMDIDYSMSIGEVEISMWIK